MSMSVLLANALPRGVYPKYPEVACMGTAWSVQRQGRKRLYVASSLRCDSSLPHSEGSNESPV